MSETSTRQIPDLSAIIEALIFSAEKPVSAQEIINVIVEERLWDSDGEVVDEMEFSDAAVEVAAEQKEPGQQDGEMEESEKSEMGWMAEGKASEENSEHGQHEGSSAQELQDLKREMYVTRVRGQVFACLEKLKEAYAHNRSEIGHGFALLEVAGGYVFRTNPRVGRYVARHKQVKPQKLSKAAIECLAIIAYQQPVTKPQVDSVRGVDSSGVIKHLLDRGLVRVLGRKDEPGRPLLYGTSQKFLSVFNLKGLSDLPTLRDLDDLEAGREPQEQQLPSVDEIQDLSSFTQSVNLDEQEEESLLGAMDGAIKRLGASRRGVDSLLAQENRSQDAKQASEQEAGGLQKSEPQAAEPQTDTPLNSGVDAGEQQSDLPRMDESNDEGLSKL